MALMRMFWPISILLVPLVGCASARLGSVHRADRGVMIADAETPIVAIVTERGVQKLAGNSVVRMNPTGRWAVVAGSNTRPRWSPWKQQDPQGAGMILTLTNVTFTAVDLESGQVQPISHGFNAD